MEKGKRRRKDGNGNDADGAGGNDDGDGSEPSGCELPLGAEMSPNATLEMAALALARKYHEGQKRKYSGKPYITHPARVAAQAIKLGMDSEAVAAAILHDTLEDTMIKESELLAISPKTHRLVVELTNNSKKLFPSLNRAGRKQADLHRIKGISKEAKTIKLLDRIDNLSEMKKDIEDGLKVPPDFVKLYAGESANLLEVLRGTHPELEKKLETLIKELQK